MDKRFTNDLNPDVDGLPKCPDAGYGNGAGAETGIAAPLWASGRLDRPLQGLFTSVS